MRIYRFITLLPVMAVFFFGCKTGSHSQPVSKAIPAFAGADSIKILYIGTYTENESRAAGKSAGIYVYEMNMNTGNLNFLGNSPKTVNPSYLAVDPGKQTLYAVNETGNDKNPGGSISSFRLLKQGKEIEFINTVPSEGNDPCYVSLDKTGKLAMCANYGSGTVAVIPIMDDGSLGKVTSTDQHKIKRSSPRQESAHAHLIMPSMNNRFVYSCDLGTDNIFIYKLDAKNGKLLPSGQKYSTKAGAGPRHLAFHPLRNFAYEVNELNGTIEVMNVDTLTGGLTRIQIIPTVDSAGMEAACADIHLTPSGKYLYASNRGKINTLAIYSVDGETGKLTLIDHQPVKGKTPRNFAIDPTGTFLLVANQDSDNVVTFRIDQSTGKLTDTGVEITVPWPVCIKFLN